MKDTTRHNLESNINPCEVCNTLTASKYGVCERTPECKIEHYHKYYAANREQERKRRRRYREAHPVVDRNWRLERREYMANWRLEHRLELKAYIAEWHTAHPLYVTWAQIKTRCFNPNATGFKNWGGRGITVYEPWIDDYDAFEAWMMENLGPRPEGMSIDRIDTYHGNYAPGEIRWADAKTQRANQRVPGGCPIRCDDCP